LACLRWIVRGKAGGCIALVFVVYTVISNKPLAQGCQSFLIMVRTSQQDSALHMHACSAAAAHEEIGSQVGKAHDADDVDTSGLMPAEELRTLIEEFKDMLVLELPPGLPPDRDVPHTIPTEEGKPHNAGPCID